MPAVCLPGELPYFAVEVPNPATLQKIEGLFRKASQDRTKAVELKQELDRLGVFKQYEDQFLDLFRHGG